MTVLTAPELDLQPGRGEPASTDPVLAGSNEPPRVLLPLAGPVDPAAIDVAVQLAKADGAMLVALYLTIVPLRYDADSPEHDASWLATPLFEDVEWAALGSGVPVCTRIAAGRTLRHALARLWADEAFVRVVATAPRDGETGFTEGDLAWLVAHAPSAALVLKPAPDPEPAADAWLSTALAASAIA